MNNVLRMLLVATAALLIGLAPAWAVPLTAAELARLVAGEVIFSIVPDDRGAAGRIEAAIDIPAPPPTVWRVMLDCARAARFVSGLESCRIVEADPAGRWDVREHRINMLTLVPRLRNVFRSSYEPHRTIAFSRVDGDLSILEGAWRLEPIQAGAGTRLRYEARIGLAAPIPDFIVRGAVESDLPRMLKALSQEVTGHARR